MEEPSSAPSLKADIDVTPLLTALAIYRFGIKGAVAAKVSDSVSNVRPRLSARTDVQWEDKSVCGLSKV